MALACCEKHTYDVRLNLHTFMHFVSEAPGVVLKLIRNESKEISPRDCRFYK